MKEITFAALYCIEFHKIYVSLRIHLNQNWLTTSTTCRQFQLHLFNSNFRINITVTKLYTKQMHALIQTTIFYGNINE